MPEVCDAGGRFLCDPLTSLHGYARLVAPWQMISLMSPSVVPESHRLYLLCSQHFLDRFCRLDELLDHGIQLGEIILALLDFSNKFLLLLELLLSSLFQLETDLVFVLDTRRHEVMLGRLFVLGELFEEFFAGDEGKSHVLVTVRMLAVYHIVLRKDVLVVFGGRDLRAQRLLLILQVVQTQNERIVDGPIV